MKTVNNNKSLDANQNKTSIAEDRFMRAPHGGNLTAAALETGLEPHEFLDFSVNINPLGPPGCVQDICSQSIRFLGEYPDPHYRKLKKSLADAAGVSTDWITVGNGSTELIYLLPKILSPGKKVVIVAPCFSEYERAFQQAGAPVLHFNLEPSNKFSLPVDKFLFQIRQCPNLGGIVIGHPNNPTGNLLEENTFQTLNNFCESRGIFLIVDETFIDFSTSDKSFLKYTDTNSHLILIRSMTKFYSLPGLRLGYGIMHPKRVIQVENHQPPWSINGLAQAMGSALSQDTKFSAQSKSYIQQENEFLYKKLKEITTIEVFPSDANFILFRLHEDIKQQAQHFFETLLYQGIISRNCGNFIGLDSSFFRVAIKNRNDNQVLLSRMHEYFQLNGN